MFGVKRPGSPAAAQERLFFKSLRRSAPLSDPKKCSDNTIRIYTEKLALSPLNIT